MLFEIWKPTWYTGFKRTVVFTVDNGKLISFWITMDGEVVKCFNPSERDGFELIYANR